MKYPINAEFDALECEKRCTGNVLICTVGLPRSGKSTWARKLVFPKVNPDSIRLALTGKRWWGPIEHQVWAMARTMVRALFLAGHKIVVLDSTNLSRKARDAFTPSEDVDWKRRFILFDTPILVCEERAKQTYPELCAVIEHMERTRDKIDEEVEGQIIERIKWTGNEL